MMMGVYDAAAICKAIAVDFKVKGLTHETAVVNWDVVNRPCRIRFQERRSLA